MRRPTPLVLALGLTACLIAGGCASSEPHQASAPAAHRPVSLAKGDSVGRLLVRSSPAIATGHLDRQPVYATVDDSQGQ